MSITEKRYVLTRWRERRMWRQRSTLPFNPSDCTCCVWNHRNMPEGADRSGFCYQLGEQPKKICDERLEHFEADFHIGYQRVCDRIILLKKGRAETATEKPEGGE